MSEEIKKNRRRKITCPHCSNAIWVGFVTSIEIDGVSTSQGSVDHHVTLITPGQAEFLRNATYDGLMTAFKEAVSESNVANHAPKDIGKFLLTVLKTSKQKAIPSEALNMLLKNFGYEDRLEIRSSQSIGMVVRTGKLAMFLPSHYLLGNSIRSVTTGALSGRHEDVDTSPLRIWLASSKGEIHSRQLMTFLTRIALENGEREFFGPCFGCGTYFPTVDLLEGHLCDRAETIGKMERTRLIQGGLASPR